MCGCECCISAKRIHLSLLSWRDRYLKKLKDQSQNSQSRRSSEKAHHIYETYKNTVMAHGRHSYAKAYDMESATTCTYPQSDHALPHCKCVLQCCADCPYINISDQETTKKHDETTPSIRFHIYHIIGCCTAHGGITLKDKKMCCMCGQIYLPDQLEHKDSTAIQNTSDISNTDDIHSCVTPRKQNISFCATSTPPCLTLAASIKRNARTLPTYR